MKNKATINNDQLTFSLGIFWRYEYRSISIEHDIFNVVCIIYPALPLFKTRLSLRQLLSALNP